LADEQAGIEAERAKAEHYSARATFEAGDLIAALREATALIDSGRVKASRATRRLINQALYQRILITADGAAEPELTAVYAELIPMARPWPRPPARAGDGPRKAYFAGPGPETTMTPFFGAMVRTSIKWRRGRDSNPRRTLPPLLA
jgi:hypothetical protein